MTSQNNDEDLDTFLTTIESKLRGPFSSLDLAKAVTTNALRGTHTPTQYLQNLSKVLSRTDKVIQSRMLIGLLGLEQSNPKERRSVDREIYNILQQAQKAPTHEKWVRIIAGLIQGIMFRDQEQQSESDEALSEFHRPCRGAEASKQLTKLCDEVCAAVSEAQEESNKDLNASFVPYRYSLLPPSFVKTLIPETTNNPHFQVNTEASILKVDKELERQRAKEDNHGPVMMKTKMSGSTIDGDASKASAAAKATTLPPGFRPTKLVQSQKAKSTSTSMFMPKKTNLVQAQRQKVLQKTALRRKGTAQALVNKTKINKVGAPGAGGPAASAAGGGTSTTNTAAAAAAARFRAKAAGSAGRSRMKMIDEKEVAAINQEHAARDAASETATNPRMISKKRRIMEAAAASKKAKTDGQEAGADGGLQPSTSQEMPSQPSNGGGGQPPQQQEEEWKIMLKERSNKLSDAERERVRQFFENRFNPTPDQSVVKMKLHEQRSKDPETGQDIKETFYLELDYNNFSSKQARKVKRY